MRELRSLLPFLRPYRSTYAFGLLLIVVSNRFAVLGPRYLQEGIDALEAGAPFAAVQRAVLLLLAVALVGGVARYGMRQLLNSGSRRVETDMRDQLYHHLQRMSPEFYDRYPTGDVMARTTNDLLAVRQVAGPALMYLVDTITRAIFIVPVMMQTSLQLAALALAPLLGLPVAMIVLGRIIHRRTELIQAQFSELTNFVHENLSGVRVVRAYRQEHPETEEFRRLNDAYIERNLGLARVQGSFFPLLGLLGGLSAVIVLFVGGRLVMSGAASMGRINELFRQTPAITSPAEPRRLPPAAGARSLTFDGVWFRYPGAHERGWVLEDVSFTVEAGRSLAIVGATGSGKSTLADLIVRAYDPDRGSIRIDGVDVREIPLAELRRAVGFVPQETFLFSEPLRENVLLGAPDDGRLERVSEVAQLTEAIPALPRGYDTMLGERGINLSGGQKQRTAIARALAQDPPIFVLDDALSAVDAHTEARILAALRSALAGRTSVIVSHRLAAVRDADWILVLDRGKVVEQGIHADLLAAGGRYWELLRRQELEAELENGAAAESGAGEAAAAPPA